jgi:hypothetical protein
MLSLAYSTLLINQKAIQRENNRRENAVIVHLTLLLILSAANR